MREVEKLFPRFSVIVIVGPVRFVIVRREEDTRSVKLVIIPAVLFLYKWKKRTPLKF